MRIIIVSNRLPLTAAVDGEHVSLTPSTGGVATGLSAYAQRAQETEMIWVGWPGADIPPALQAEVRAQLAKQQTVPVFLQQELMEQYYDGFCNKTIWPLYHYFPSLVAYKEEQYEAYVEVNRLFAATLATMLQPDDLVWVHDYQLMLLPALLRERFPKLQIGFFLHIPFPSFELFQQMPKHWAESLLKGMLGADVVGFHTYDYTQHFLQCCLRMLGLEQKLGLLQVQERAVKADTFPMGIDFAKYHDALNPGTQRLAEELKMGQQTKVILSIDRLDYSKGIAKRLAAYEQFLTEYPQWREQVVLIAVAVPSRVNVDDYQAMKKELDEIVGRINGKFATLNWTPIIYQYRSLPFEELLAYYTLSDVALVTPLRDGMNLVAKEYIASRREKTGVLILSEMAGAAKELGEALLINPNDQRSFVEAIRTALEMPILEQQRRNSIMQQRLQRYDVMRWAEEFLGAVQQLHADESLSTRIISQEERARMVAAYAAAKDRLLLLDYDGTLVHFAARPELAVPDAALLDLLARLASQAQVIIISGRDRATLESWFGHLPVGIIAEHGAQVKTASWEADPALQTGWKKDIAPILERYADRLPGAFVEQKEYALCYHYRLADPELGSVRTKELLDALTSLTANMNVHILPGNKVIEVRCAGIDKGIAARRFVHHEFVLAIGDDWTDEDLFMAMPKEAFTIRVGSVVSHAQYSMRNVAEVRLLLEELARATTPETNHSFARATATAAFRKG